MSEVKYFEENVFKNSFVDPKEIERVLDSYVESNLSYSEWQAIYKLEHSRLRSNLSKHKWLRWVPGALRSQRSVNSNYNIQWAEYPAEKQVEAVGKCVPLEWGDRHFMGRAIVTKRIHLLYLMKIIEAIQPESVLEVGSGNGLNLIELSAYLPQLKLTGLELTFGGVEAARRLAEKDRLPVPIIEFSPLPPKRDSVRGEIDFQIGDASKMSFDTASFDLIYTSLALEQMEEVRSAALREIARVARKWVVMIEPFRDFNEGGIRGAYIDANRYFSARVDELKRYGLNPVSVFHNIPHKMTLKVAIVISQKL